MGAAPVSSQVVLVTGAGRGLGAALADVLHDRGRIVVRGVRAAGDTPGTVALDVTSTASVEAAAAACTALHGRLDVVVSNAGLPAFGPVEAVNPAVLARILDVNVVGPHRVVRAALPHLRRSGGAVVVISSGLARVPVPFTAVYGASKAAAEALADGLAVEVAADGVVVAVVQPGPISTAFAAHTDGASVDADRMGPYADLQALAAADRERRRSTTDAVAMTAEAVAATVADLLDQPRDGWPHRLVVHPSPAPLEAVAAAEVAARREVLLARGYGAHLPPSLGPAPHGSPA